MRALVLTPPGTPAPVATAIDSALTAGGHARLDPSPPPRALDADQRAWFLATLDRMHEADAVVADVSASDATVAWALAWFLARGRLAVVCCSREARPMLSPMIAGNPSPWQRVLVYDSPEALETALRGTLTG